MRKLYESSKGMLFHTVQPYDSTWLLASRYHTTVKAISTLNPGIDLNHLRMLWEQHIAWTRMTIISIIAGLPDVDFVTKRLLRNPLDFKKALKPYYDEKKCSTDTLT